VLAGQHHDGVGALQPIILGVCEQQNSGNTDVNQHDHEHRRDRFQDHAPDVNSMHSP
jgi:hypothetical protein